jgi:hypothetical protein
VPDLTYPYLSGCYCEAVLSIKRWGTVPLGFELIDRLRCFGIARNLATPEHRVEFIAFFDQNSLREALMRPMQVTGLSTQRLTIFS